MKKPLTLKLLAMAALMLLLLIPISQIDGLIQDRQKLQQTVVADIAKSSSYHQTLAGPVWVQPYTKAEIKIKRINADGEKMYEEEVVNGELYFLPQAAWLRLGRLLFFVVQQKKDGRPFLSNHLYVQ